MRKQTCTPYTSINGWFVRRVQYYAYAELHLSSSSLPGCPQSRTRLCRQELPFNPWSDVNLAAQWAHGVCSGEQIPQGISDLIATNVLYCTVCTLHTCIVSACAASAGHKHGSCEMGGGMNGRWWGAGLAKFEACPVVDAEKGTGVFHFSRTNTNQQHDLRARKVNATNDQA